jgi:hypothetical protein
VQIAQTAEDSVTTKRFKRLLKQKLLAVGLLVLLTGAGQWLSGGVLWGLIVGAITYGIWSAIVEEDT